MSTQVENRERRDGYTPRVITQGLIAINYLLDSLAQTSFYSQRIEAIRLGIERVVRESKVFETDDSANPFVDTTIDVGIDISRHLRGAIVDRAKPVLNKPGFQSQETKFPGLHFLEVFPDEISKKVSLVGDRQVERIFPNTNT